MSSFEEEFETVSIVLASTGITKNVDAFCLTWIKLERQLRKLTANILYQGSVFADGDDELKAALSAELTAKKALRYTSFGGGIRKLTGCSMKELIGREYQILNKGVSEAYDFRNKIFHGLQTGHSLDSKQLALAQKKVQRWCELLAQNSEARFHYDGFGRNSLRKNGVAKVVASVDALLETTDWKLFIRSL